MNKMFEKLEDKLKELEIRIEKLIVIQNNIQENYIKLYDELQILRKELQNLMYNYNKSIAQITTEIKWLEKLKNYSLLTAGIGGIVYIIYEFLK